MLHRSRRLSPLILLLTVLQLALGPLAIDTRAQTPGADRGASFPASTNATIDFPNGIALTATLDLAGLAPDGSGRVDLLYRIGDDPTLHLVPAAPPSMGLGTPVRPRVEATIDLMTSFVPAGVDLHAFWRVPLAGGGHADSEPALISWIDTRWPWRTFTTDQVTLNYYAHDPAFATAVLDSAQATITDLERRFNLSRSAPLQIWLYPSSGAFRGAQQTNSRENVAGASYPGYLLIAAIVPDGDHPELDRVIPHEVSHQVLYQATKNPFTLPPLWFDEGLATHYQIGGTEGFLDMVTRALESDTLFDPASLDTTFPYGAAQATLAYATSWSIITWIRDVHGDGAIGAMIAAFATGQPYGEAIDAALGMSRQEFGTEWRAWIASEAVSQAATDRAILFDAA